MGSSRPFRVFTVALVFVLVNVHRSYNEDFYVDSFHHGGLRNQSNLDLFENAASLSQQPFVLLHVGPHKTGTTSLQDFLVSLQASNHSSLQKDNIEIPTLEHLPGMAFKNMPFLNFAHCQIDKYKRNRGMVEKKTCEQQLESFGVFLRRTYSQMKNVIIIAEDLDRTSIDYERLQLYLKPYERIRVVVTYRRLHDWLPSWYNQIVDMYTGVYCQNEQPYPSFVDWLEQRFDNIIQVHTIPVAERYGKFAESVDIMNMHENVNLVENLFCNHIPGADATCQAIKDGVLKLPQSNVGRSHEYERLAVAASNRTKISFKMHKAILKLVARDIKEAMEELLPEDEIPRQCPSQSFLDNLLRMEMEQEKQFLPDWYERQGGDEGLKSSFDKAMQSKLCSWNVTKIISSGILDNAFSKIKEPSY